MKSEENVGIMIITVEVVSRGKEKRLGADVYYFQIFGKKILEKSVKGLKLQNYDLYDFFKVDEMTISISQKD